ncbi:hypothetical protein C7M52_02494 [Mixta theicola]|nr:hypothetical protein C7M52_02494 [Mixta theicola]
MAVIICLLSYFRPITPTIQPTHIQSWDIQPKRRTR